MSEYPVEIVDSEVVCPICKSKTDCIATICDSNGNDEDVVWCPKCGSISRKGSYTSVGQMEPWETPDLRATIQTLTQERDALREHFDLGWAKSIDKSIKRTVAANKRAEKAEAQGKTAYNEGVEDAQEQLRGWQDMYGDSAADDIEVLKR